MTPQELLALKQKLREEVRAELTEALKQRFQSIGEELRGARELAQRRKAELDRARDEIQHLAATLGASVGFWYWRAPAELSLTAPIRRLLPGATGSHSIAELLLPRMPEAARPAVAAALQALHSGALKFLAEEFELLPAGSRWMQLRARVVANHADGSAAAISGTLADISERKLLEQKRLVAEQLVMQSTREQGLALLAGGVAHDLNELLQTLIGNAELAQSEVAAGSSVADYLGNVMRVGRQAGELCSQLLAYAGHGRYVMQPLDLNALVAGAADVLKLIARRQRVELKVLTCAEPVVADADPVQLKQVLSNLVKNASEASAASAEPVELRVSLVDIDPDGPPRSLYPEGSAMPGRYACLEVSDHGYGMDEATRKRMFEPFFSTKFTGRGLGLAATAGIVRSHGGLFEVDSEAGRGTRIAVLLPQSWQLPEAVPGLTPIPAKQRFRARVLVVDDHPEVQDIAARMLGRLGFQVHSAHSGEQAIKQVEALTGRLDLVLMDLIMPGMGGEAACIEIKRRFPQLKVVLMTGYYDRMLRQNFVAQGFDGLITKPFQIEDLTRSLAAVLDEGEASRDGSAADTQAQP
jgi:signal transduction histidine kinase/ActR/RegA family two-component response regulator